MGGFDLLDSDNKKKDDSNPPIVGKQNVCYYCCNNNNKELDSEVYHTENESKCLLLEFNNKLDYIIKYIDSKQDKNTIEDIETCYTIIKKQGYITKDDIDQDSRLFKKYTQRNDTRHYLFKELLHKHPDLVKFNSGQGNKVWICKKDKEQEIRKLSKVKIQKTKNKNYNPSSDIDKYNYYFTENYRGIQLSINKIHSILRDTFSIKKSKTRSDICRRLSKKPNVVYDGTFYTFKEEVF